MVTFGKCNGGGRRSSAREAVPLVAVFTTVTRSHRAVLVDISRTGARLSGDDLPELHEDLLLSVDRLRAFGTVAWSEGREFGIVFTEPLEDHDVQSLRRKAAIGLTPELKAALDDWTLGLAR